MKKRLITGILLVVILVPLLVIDWLFPVLQIVAGLFVLVGVHEMLKLFGHDKTYGVGVQTIIYLSSLLIYISGLTFGAEAGKILRISPDLPGFKMSANIGIAMILVAVILQLSLLVFSPTFDARDVSKSLMISAYVGLGVASIIALRNIGVRVIVYLFLITTLTDVFAYVYGMLFGKHKMIERISPKKTWEGSIGGTIVATVTASLFAFLYPYLFNDTKAVFDMFSLFNIHPAVEFIIIFIITFIASIVSQIGDLVASRLKRTYDIKDFGTIFPGHGGFLDRFDSSILTSMFILAAFLILSAFVPASISILV